MAFQIQICAKIYGNLLENAVDAVKDLLPENKPYVKMLTKVKNRKLLIEISNPYSNGIQRRGKKGFFIQQSMKALESEQRLWQKWYNEWADM